MPLRICFGMGSSCDDKKQIPPKIPSKECSALFLLDRIRIPNPGVACSNHAGGANNIKGLQVLSCNPFLVSV